MDQGKMRNLEKIAEIAALCGIRGEIDEENECFSAACRFGDGRTQRVFIRQMITTPNGDDVATFFSPARIVKKGVLRGGLSKEDALDLLARNENALFARFGIWSNRQSDMVVASVDAILDTLDTKEFEAHIMSVAVLADQYEEEHGDDRF